MAQKKLKRFNEIKTFSNVLEYPAGIKGNWSGFFKNANPVTLELACGKGEYSVGLARLYENRNFIGVDLKGNRLWVGARTALRDQIKNVGFLRTQIEKIDQYFNPGEVDEIWITFPDPQLRVSKAKKRLTHPRFLRLYQHFIRPGGIINLKTDSPDLYNFTKTVLNLFDCEIVEDLNDVYAGQKVSEELAIKTYYETLDIAGSQKIHYLRFRLNAHLPFEKDEVLKQIL